MCADVVLVLILVLNGDVSCSLLSRFRNRHEYKPNADLEVIRNLDDKTYEELMNEIPILRQVLKGNRTAESPASSDDTERPSAATSPPLDDGISSTSTDTQTAVEYSSLDTTTKVIPFKTHWPAVKHRGTEKLAPRIEIPYLRTFPYLISCFWCGMNESSIPGDTVCFDIFDSDDTGVRALARLFRAQCYYHDTRNSWQERTVPQQYDANNNSHIDFSRIKVKVVGRLMRGCFKRYVDVSPLYTARGCRGAHHPWRSYTKNFAAHRLMKLEMLTMGHDDICIHSPEASLTPFSPHVSLFVRYHVCVCSTSYCNRGRPRAPRAPLSALLLLLALTTT